MAFRFNLLVSLAVALAFPGIAHAANPAPEELLSARGLTKFGQYYVLEADAKLDQSLRAVQTEERKYNEAKKRHTQLEQDVQEGSAMLDSLDSQNAQQTKILDHISKNADGTYNHQVGVVNAIRKKYNQLLPIVQDRKRQLAADPEPSNADYVDSVVKLSDAMEQMNRRYQELARDQEVKSALQSLSQITAAPLKLGPSPRFVSQLPSIRRLRDKVAPIGVHLDMIGGVPEVPVTINDAAKEDMIVEAAAPYMCITQSTAEKLGIQPNASKQTVRLTNPEGQAIEAALVTLKTVRLGDFAVENVPCAIEPESMKGAKNVLGKSILKHFVFRLDVPNGLLHLSQIDGAPVNTSSSRSP